MALEKFGIGIVGCGNISDTHANAITHSEKGALVSAFSRNESKLNAFSKKYSINGFQSYQKFLEDPGLDVVSICTPSGTHLDYGKKAAEMGKHVITEKPIEITTERGQALINACQTCGVNLAIIYQNRFIDDIIEMKKALENEEIGKLIMANASVRWFRSQEYYNESDWRGTLKLDGGGIVINQSIHTIDLLQWFMGKVDSVFALTSNFTHQQIEAEDTAVACLRFENGAMGVFEGSTSIIPPQKRRIEINGSTGTALLDGNQFVKLDKDQNNTSAKQGEASGAASPLDGMTFVNHQRQFDQIFSAFQNNEEPVVSGKESLKSLSIVEAIYRSAKNGNPVYL
ncbi:MAG TPA: Gfo/Idh/MocA family oxidoreductase [Balneolaceae bacterium]|nr:Gfo/Idh/MocA family oxidoreductase [Balneolaceae bacterium]